jgi:RHS repeat-associated protein
MTPLLQLVRSGKVPDWRMEDANHHNPRMFAGGRFDIEIGLYYNRARYYNPFTGRYRRQSIYPDDP